jgi:hypothetical protein
MALAAARICAFNPATEIEGSTRKKELTGGSQLFIELRAIFPIVRANPTFTGLKTRMHCP